MIPSNGYDVRLSTGSMVQHGRHKVTFSITKYFLPSVQDNVNIIMTMVNTSQPQHFS